MSVAYVVNIDIIFIKYMEKYFKNFRKRISENAKYS